MSDTIPMEAFKYAAEAFRHLGVEYYIGGSIASVAHGTPRSTVDIDIIADIRNEHVDSLVRLLEDRYYIDGRMMRDAIQRRASFNIIHLETMYKLDVFVLGTRGFDRSAWSRTVPVRPFEDHEEEYPIASAEDTILSKLEWYRRGGEKSERQWLDVIGVMKVQAGNLDWEYMMRWAPEIGVADLLERARHESDS